MEAIRLSRELGEKNQTETDVVVTVTGLIPIPIRSAAVHWVIEVAAATNDTIVAPTVMILQNPGNHPNILPNHAHILNLQSKFFFKIRQFR